jgi:hypothetical protein
MEINTLVRHKKGKFNGIGCISKVNHKTVKVNVGKRDVTNYKKDDIEVVDVSDCKTITFFDLRRMMLCNSKDMPDLFIIGNMVNQYMGIGAIQVRVVTESDLATYPRVI